MPSDDQVRGRYCDGTYLQTGHTTEGDDFDAWLARVRRDAYAWGRHDERMSLAYAPPESGGRPTGGEG